MIAQIAGLIRQVQISHLLILGCSITLFNSCNQPSNINYLNQSPPGLEAKLFADSTISSKLMEHSSPAFSPDGSVVVWTVVDRSFQASMYEMTYDGKSWSSPHRTAFADSTSDDYYPSFSPDGKKLYFSSRRKSSIQTRDMRIWQVERTTNDWGVPTPLDTTISKGVEYAHSITSNGSLYFSAAMGGGTNFNLQKAEFQNGTYTKAFILPYNINSVDYEDGPYVSPDESFLIFESIRPEGISSDVDLFISFRSIKGEWSVPVNMGPKINTSGAERFARLSPDGRYLFFGSTRNQSEERWGFDIFWIDAKIIDELKNENLLVFIPQPLGDEIIQALYKNNNEAAAKGLKEWISNYPESLDATILYSEALRKQQNFAEAEKVLAAQSPQWRDNINIIIETALVKFGLNKNSEAEELLKPVLIPGDQLRQHYILLSNALMDMHLFERSDNYFNLAIAINSNQFEFKRRGVRFALLGENDKAFENLKKSKDMGLNSRQAFEDDPDLKSLHSDLRWKPFLDSFK